MIRSLNSGVSGLRQFQTKLDVIGNNIANSNTVGYNSARTTFADTFSQTLQGGSSAGGALQVGAGVQTSAIKNNFARGVFQNTARESDLYIDGQEGFFMVKDSLGRQFATRAGDFVVDREGYLVTNNGLRVQGFSDQIDPATGSFANRGDIRIFYDKNNSPVPPKQDPDAQFAGFNILEDGKVRVRLSDGTEYLSGQVLLQRFQDLQLLQKEGENLFSNLEEAGPLNGDINLSVAPKTHGMGKLISGALEVSNVDLATEFADLITTQRGFQANARIITTSDEVLQELVNLKR